MNRVANVTQAPGSEPLKAEEDRIRAAYTRRHTDSRYSQFNPGHLFTIQQLERQIIRSLKKHRFASLDKRRILEVGCGTGFWLREFIQWGTRPENIFGIDLLHDRVAEAKQLCPKGMRLQCGTATRLPFPDSNFDLVLQATVFTSILDSPMKQRIAAEMLRVVKEDGLILWYDYHINNPWNSDVKGIKKREIRELFLDCQIELKRITLVPPLVRSLAPYFWIACYCLEKIPWLCTHYLGVIRKGKPRQVN
jgi:ubiquinone/menaquinone biosynthesis C-methylase UbiE